jgi:hypothetical protein
MSPVPARSDRERRQLLREGAAGGVGLELEKASKLLAR